MPVSQQSDGAAKGLVYSSQLMHDRRRRILDAARTMIAEKGLDDFSMRELGKRADVALRTLYNAFQSKDHLIAVAVKEYYEDFVRRSAYQYDASTIEGTIERLLLVHRRNMRIKNYTRTVMSVYFSPGTDPELWQTIHRISADNHRLWLARLAERRQLQPWVDVGSAADRMANLEYATINEWCQDRVSDAEFVHQLIGGVLTFAAGLTRGIAYKAIVASLVVLSTADLRDDATFLKALAEIFESA
jgi:AcrR family transcriptional regulator